MSRQKGQRVRKYYCIDFSLHDPGYVSKVTETIMAIQIIIFHRDYSCMA